MSFLWNAGQKPRNNTKFKPSPKRKHNSYIDGSIERASLLTLFKTDVQASMTVEAALLLPLFLFLFVNLGSALEMIRLHGNLQLALWETGNRMCVYGHLGSYEDGEDLPESVLGDLGEIALSYTYVKGQVVDYVGSGYLEESPVTNGTAGLQFWESDAGDQKETIVSDDILDIVMTYQVSAPLNIPGIKPFRMCNRYYGRLWTGYDVARPKGPTDMVYVAENASVYHETPACTHLKLTVRKVTLKEAQSVRNENGGKYTECSKCWDGKSTTQVYIAREGDFYHKDRNCPGLKRTVYTMTRSEAEAKYKACSRCR